MEKKSYNEKTNSGAEDAKEEILLKLKDPKRYYLQAIGETPLLNRGEETELAKIIQSGENAKKAMIEYHLNLVLKLTDKYTSSSENAKYRIYAFRAGMVALLSAAESFDYRKQPDFRTYATHMIEDKIQEQLTVIKGINYSSYAFEVINREVLERIISKTIFDIPKEKLAFIKTLNSRKGELDKSYEKELAMLIEEGKEAKRTLIDHNLRLVVSFVKDYENKGVSYFDLIQSGNLGLSVAAGKFDYRKDVKFSTYASYYIRGEILEALRNRHVITPPKNIWADLYSFKRIEEMLANELGRKPKSDELTMETGLTEDEIRKLRALDIADPLSLHKSIGDDDGVLADVIPDEGASDPCRDIEVRELRKKCADILVQVPADEFFKDPIWKELENYR